VIILLGNLREKMAAQFGHILLF